MFKSTLDLLHQRDFFFTFSLASNEQQTLAPPWHRLKHTILATELLPQKLMTFKKKSTIDEFLFWKRQGLLTMIDNFAWIFFFCFLTSIMQSLIFYFSAAVKEVCWREVLKVVREMRITHKKKIFSSFWRFLNIFRVNCKLRAMLIITSMILEEG